MEQGEYLQYLKTKHWANKKEELFSVRGTACEICASNSYLQVHHLSYEHIYNEPLIELQILCRKCHRLHHGLGKNLDFVQVYKAGFEFMDNIVQTQPKALRLYLYIALKAAKSDGAFIAQQSELTARFQCSARTINRWLQYLKEHDAIDVKKTGDNHFAYCINPIHVWRSAHKNKKNAAFKKIDNHNQINKKRMHKEIKEKVKTVNKQREQIDKAKLKTRKMIAVDNIQK